MLHEPIMPNPAVRSRGESPPRLSLRKVPENIGTPPPPRCIISHVISLSATNRNSGPPARLALEDGSVFAGAAFGNTEPRSFGGEVCFNTSLSGYQEVLTDPSYAGQIVTMTYPLIGNYGVNEEDHESQKVQVKGFVIRELANRVSNFRSTLTLQDWLCQQGITGISGIDTRSLTRKLRIDGAMNGSLAGNDRSG